MIGRTNGKPISITGLGCHVPERVLTNDELATMVDTNDEWIRERTGIRERRFAAREEALTDVALPACRRALEMAGCEPSSIDLLIVATVTPDMSLPVVVGTACRHPRNAGCRRLRPVRRLYRVRLRDRQAHAMLAAGLAKRALVVGGDVLSKILDWTDRSTLVLFGDGAGAVVMESDARGGFGHALVCCDGRSNNSNSHQKLLASGYQYVRRPLSP